MGFSVGGGAVDVSEDANLSDRKDVDLGGGGAGWWIRYRFPRVMQRALGRLSKQSLILFQFPPKCIFCQPGKGKW